MKGSYYHLINNTIAAILPVVLMSILWTPLHAQQSAVSDTFDIIDARGINAPAVLQGNNLQPAGFGAASFVETAAPEGDFYDPRFFLGGFDGNIIASHEHDGELYIGGWFTWFNGEQRLNAIGRWDGSTWVPVGEGFNNQVSALASFNGDLIAGGWFTHAGGNEVNRIARWDGSSWQPMGDGFDSGVEALVVHDNELYAGGRFSFSGSTEVLHLAKWDGSAWQPVGGGVDGPVFALASISTGLAVGGLFTNHGYVSDMDPSLFTGTYLFTQQEASTSTTAVFADGWLFNAAQEFEAELTESSFSDREFTTVPFAEFTSTEATFSLFFDKTDSTIVMTEQSTGLSCDGEGIYYGPAETIAGSFDPSDDSQFTFGIKENTREDCDVAPDEVLFTVTKVSSSAGAIATGTPGSTTANNIALWTGSEWQVMGDGLDNSVRTLIEFDGDIYAGGFFTNSGTTEVNRVARWDGSAWQPVGNGFGGSGIDGTLGAHISPGVYTLISDGTDLIASGTFSESNGTPLNYIARWNGSSWEDLGLNLEGAGILSATLFNGDIFAGLGVLNFFPGRVTAVTLSSGSWSHLGAPKPGLGTDVQAAGMYVDEGTIYLGGRFTRAGDAVVNSVAQWTTSNGWEPMGNGLDGFVRRMHVFEGTPIAAGNPFPFNDGTEFSAIASWDGTSWSPMGSGIVNGSVWRLFEYNNELIIGGIFFEADGNAATGIARWNGTDWEKIGNGLQGPVFGLTEYNGDLIAGGFDVLGGGELLARWDGSQWHTFSSSGIDGEVSSLAVHDGELYAGVFDFNTSVWFVARWDEATGNWEKMGGNFASTVLDLESHGGELYAADFFPADETLHGGLSRWNGSDWEPVGGGLNGGGHSLVSTPEGLYFAGYFRSSPGVASSGLALWVTDLEAFIATPTNLGIQDASGPVELSWDEHPSDRITEFLIYRGAAAAELSEYAAVDASGTSFEETDPADGTAFYAVTAVDDGGTESRFSNTVSYHTSTEPVPGEWMLTSIPVDGSAAPPDGTLIYRFVGSYQAESSLSPSTGYWIKSDASGDYEVRGPGLQQAELALSTGWNLIGGLVDAVETAAINDPSGILTNAPVYGYNGGAYEEVTVLDPLEGYWLFADQEGTVNLQLDAGAGAAAKVRELLAEAEPKPAELIFRLNDGQTKQRFIVSDAPLTRQQKQRWLMPPPAPDPQLDVRTLDGYRVADQEVTSYPVEVELTASGQRTATYLLVAVDAEGNRSQIELQPGQKQLLGKAYASLSLERLAEEGDQMITETKLNPNYPNPFNPATTISYQIAQQARVTVQIYDVIGRRVATLVNNREQQAGKYTVRFDASRLASGMYFVRMKAGSFEQIQKITLIK